jgi:hypothetical protein
MNMPILLPAKTAAMCLGVTAETLRGWRRRGIGPAYVALPGGPVGRGRTRLYVNGCACGTVVYPLDGLKAFIDKQTVQEGRLPRPHPGRLPGGRNKPKVKPAD